MPITISTDEFNRDPSEALKAANEGPVFITDHGRPARVLLSIEHYRNLVQTGQSIVEQLACPPGGEDIEFEPPRLSGISRPTDLS